jgi:dUTP pyrophosphatase
MVYSRSGHGFRHRISLVNSVGVCDSDYRGSVAVGLRNDSPIRFRYCAGDRIAQAMVVPVPKVTFKEVDELTETVRGAGGFGSTGK